MFHAWAVLTTGAMLMPGPGPAAALEFQDVLTDDAAPGWETKAGDAWQVEDGVLICPGGKGGWFGTKRTYTDFIIELEFKLEPGGNSGVFLRAPAEGHLSAVAMEVQILDDYADKHKNLKPGQYCGSIYKIAPPARRVTKPAGQWNYMRITAESHHVVVVLNGETIVDADGQSHPEILKRSPGGFVGLQNYGNRLWFRRIKLAGREGGKGDGAVLAFGIVADIQYADKDTQGERRYREGIDKFEKCVADWNRQPLAFAIQLGDIIDGNKTDQLTHKDLDKVLAVCRKVKTKLHHVIGNHCLAVPRNELMQKLGLQKGYYEFTHGNWRFIVLDTMDVSVMGWPENSRNYQAARAYLRDHPDARTYNGAVGDRQKRWLKSRLAHAAKVNQRVIVFGHHPLVQGPSRPDLLAWNHQEIARILEDAGCVVAYFNGHDHKGGYAFRNGVHYVTLEGLVEAPTNGNAHGTVHIDRNRLVIQGTGNLTSRTLECRPAKARADTTSKAPQARGTCTTTRASGP